MESKRNALAELAKSLRFVTVSRALGGHTEEYDVREYKRISDSLVKASRIIVELAKIGDTSLIPQDCYGCGLLKKISVCRAIAEEGANE